MEEPPLKWMERGEIAYDPTYHTPSSPGDDNREDVPIPNPFVIEDHFEAAISKMEERIRNSQREHGGKATYDPDDRSNPEPTPVNRTILPDLYLGWGNAKCTHTQRERLRNRLFAVLLTKLSYNYEKQRRNQDEDFFIVRMNKIDCIFPDCFIQALCDCGHSVTVCPRSTITVRIRNLFLKLSRDLYFSLTPNCVCSFHWNQRLLEWRYASRKPMEAGHMFQLPSSFERATRAVDNVQLITMLSMVA